MDRIREMTQQELANILCVFLVFTGVLLSGLSLFDIPGFDREEARSLGTKAFGVGVSIGFGVSITPSSKRRNNGQNKGSGEKIEGS